MNYRRAVKTLKQPGTRLTVSYERNRFGRVFHLEPGGKIYDKTAMAILRRGDVVPADVGLLDGCPQSWTIGGQH